MQKTKTRIGLGMVLAAAVLLAACGPAAAKEPTPDAEAIRTQAVQTAIVEMTVQAALNPTATSVPPTITPLPTATQGTAVPAQVSSSGSGSSSGGSSGGSSGPIPTWTPDVYKCAVIDEYPYDQAMHTGWMGDKVWTVKNTGIATWNTKEYYVMQLSEVDFDLTVKDQYPLRNDVSPGQTYDVIVDVWVPVDPVQDIQIEKWGIVNDNGDIFCRFFIAIPYTYPAPTKTPTKNP